MVSRAASLADEIEAAIVGGEIATGERLGTKDDLRRRFDVAYGTLNEALRILQQRGFVKSRTGPGGGLFASVPTASVRLSQLLSGFPEGGSLADCAAVRHALEEAVTLDATRSRTRTDITDLETIVERMAEKSDDPVGYLHENWRLHRRIAEICRNRVLCNLYITLLDANEPQPGVAVVDRHRAADNRQNLAAHRDLIDAIASGDEKRARRAVAAHEAFFAPVSDRPLFARPQKKRRRTLAGQRVRVRRQAPSSGR
jgi:GntR family transcriptional regulator, transcriptional repressor for pyruvate dehydrogenase complex